MVRLISACTNSQKDELQITNLSELVLDVAPYGSTQAQLHVTPPSSGLIPSPAGELEVAAQDAVLNRWTPGNPSAVFLPVGGTLIATPATGSNVAVELSITVDPDATSWSFGAWALAILVATNVPGESPEGYYGSIADCVNATLKIWDELTQAQQAPPPLTDLIDQALGVGGCAELVNQINEYLKSQAEQRDADQEAQLVEEHLNESQLHSDYTQEEMVSDEEIRSDIIIR
jgi:hypothetical protein